MNVNFRKTTRARCRGCGRVPANEMVVIAGCYQEDRNYLCQDCARELAEQLHGLNLSGTAFPPKVENKKEKFEEDLSNI